MLRFTSAVMVILVLAGQRTFVWADARADPQPKTWVATVAEKTPVMVESEMLFVLAKDSDLFAGQAEGDWLAVTVVQGKKEIRGWVQKKDLTPIEHPSQLQRQLSGDLASVRAEKRYIAFSLKCRPKKNCLLLGSRGCAKRDCRRRSAADGSGSRLSGRHHERSGSGRGRGSGDAIVVGQYIPGRARLTLDDLSVALRARFVHSEWPVVSIDPPTQPTTQRVHKVRFEGGVADTSFGYTLFEADYLLKQMGLGYEQSKVPGVPSEWEMWVKQQEYDNRRSVRISSRGWFYPELGATPTRENVAAFKGLKVGVYSEVLAATIDNQPVRDLTKVKGHTGEQFAALVREHFDELTAMHPSFRRLEQLNELVALSRAIEVMDKKPDLSWWLQDYPLHRVKTPRQVNELARAENTTHRDVSLKVTMSGGVELRAMAMRLQAGDVSALADAALTTRPSRDALAWAFVVDDWVIPVPPELSVTKGAEVTPQLVYAQFLIRHGHYAEALQRLDHILSQEPNYVNALYLKGTLLNDSLQRPDEAIACFDQILLRIPDATDAIIGRGLALLGKGNLRTGTDCFDQALRINPRLANALALRGAVPGRFGRPCEGDCRPE